MTSDEGRSRESPADVGRFFSMAGRRAFVTGGSVSIGRALALGFAEAGADVAFQYAREADAAFGKPEAATETARAIEAFGRRAAAIEADFARSGAAARGFEAAEAALGGIDVLVVCASIQKRAPFVDLTGEEVDWHIRINFKATIELMRAAVEPMARRGYGRILTIGSVNEARPDPELAVYAALKSAQTTLALALARTYAARGVTINNLAPGLIATERNRWRREDAADWERIQKTYSPAGRAGEPRDIVGPALLLCSDAGAFINGVTLRVDGGALL